MTQLLITTARAGASLVANGSNGAAQAIATTVANTAATLAANAAEDLIFGPARKRVEGPRLEQIRLQGASEGSPVPRIFGRTRIAGQVIWATKFREDVTEQTTGGGKSTRSRIETTTTSYSYSVSFAIGLCAGEISRIGRVWADGKLIQLQDFEYRFHAGSETQLPDSLIEAVEGVDAAPAYRGLAYIVFEDLPLGRFGNRVPQFTFEVERILAHDDPAALENMATAFVMIPGSGEASLATEPVLNQLGEGVTRAENVHNNLGGTDFAASVRLLKETVPATSHVALVVSWYGTDLRPAFCEIRPGVEIGEKDTLPLPWQVSGVSREQAHQVSVIDGHPAFGGTPSDDSIIAAIRHLKAEGIDVMFYPFLMMDIPPGNTLPDPDGVIGQPDFPWRGRIRPGVEDKTAIAAAGIASLFGAASVDDFQIEGEAVQYTGSEEWSLRRMILHYASLCAVAGGVHSFLIGSELRGLTTARDQNGAFPAVTAFQALATDVRQILGSETKISYAADWSEYFGYQPPDGSGDVFFHLDPLWADQNIDFVGIDNYMPVADWRDGSGHLDKTAGAVSTYDLEYLGSNITGGEGYNWYYETNSDRDSQNRTLIADVAHGEDWIFRYKDIRGWWENAHHNRPGGVRDASTTDWVPQSKPVVFTELGCAAVDKAANQPNVFLDAKSSESGLPHFSSGQRDDLMQRKFLEAHLSHWSDVTQNPISSVYGGPMVDTARIYIYTWDARPFPDFPARSDIWTDAPNWERGHWLNGRLGKVPLGQLVEELLAENGVTEADTTALKPLVTGYLVDRPMSARAALEPLAGLYQFDMVERGEGLVFVPRDGEAVTEIAQENFSQAASKEAIQTVLAQAEDMPTALEIVYTEDSNAYDLTVAAAQLPDIASNRTVRLNVPVVLENGEAVGRARMLLADSAAMRAQLQFSLPPSQLALEAGDVVVVDLGDARTSVRLTSIQDGLDRAITAQTTSPDVYDPLITTGERSITPPPVTFGPPVFELLDLPLLADERPVLRAFGFADPWPGTLTVYSHADASTPQLIGTLPRYAVMGRLTEAIAGNTAICNLRDQRTVLKVALAPSSISGAFSSADLPDVLNGRNRIALQSVSGDFEILQFTSAELQGNGVWHLSGLVRGQIGTAVEALAGADADARIVLLDDGAVPVDLLLDMRHVPRTIQAGPIGEPVGGANYVSRNMAFAGTGWRPLPPVQLQAIRNDAGITLKWIRQSRIGGGSWSGEVPVGEAFERYNVRIFDASSLLREKTVSSPVADYPQSEIDLDFGGAGPGNSLTFSVSQISDSFGLGRETTTTVRLRYAAGL